MGTTIAPLPSAATLRVSKSVVRYLPTAARVRNGASSPRDQKPLIPLRNASASLLFTRESPASDELPAI